MTDPLRIAANVASVRREIAEACARRGRDPAGVTLIAVTKNQTPDVLDALRQAGIRDFGENRIEHLLEMLAHRQPGDRWHYIGRVQGRQLAKLAPLVDTLHSLCDPDHVDRLARPCIQAGRRLPVYVQVNASGEPAKAGIDPPGLPALLSAIRAQPALETVGLMTMAPELGTHADAATVRACFARLHGLAAENGLAGLSMGMSGDLAIAIEEGATVVRVGSRLFA
jgi:pyridoxal phosphate enzyme (YggS family)